MLLRIVLKISLLTVAFVFLLVSVGFFIGALYLYLEAHFHDSVLAAFFCGLAILLFAILLLLIVLVWNRKKKIEPEHSSDIFSDLPGDVPGWVEKYPWQSIAVGAAAGFLLAFVPRLRNSLIDCVSTYMNGGSLGDCLKQFKSE